MSTIMVSHTAQNIMYICSIANRFISFDINEIYIIAFTFKDYVQSVQSCFTRQFYSWFFFWRFSKDTPGEEPLPFEHFDSV